MANDDTPQPFDPPVIPGDPLMAPADADRVVDAPPLAGATSDLETPPTSTPPIAATAPVADVPPTGTEVLGEEAAPAGRPDEEPDHGGGVLKTGALLAGAAALANKVRQEAPKKVQQLREKRAEGRCVIVTEVDGRLLAIGPYKDAAAAEPQAFRVGGDPHVVELVTDAAFFEPPGEDGG